MPRPSHTWVDELLNEVQAGFSLNAMAKTTGKMILAADRVATQLATIADNPDSSPRDIKEIAIALKAVAQSIETYAGIYTWTEQYSAGGQDQTNALQDLLPVLTRDETMTLQSWLKRLDVQANLYLR